MIYYLLILEDNMVSIVNHFVINIKKVQCGYLFGGFRFEFTNISQSFNIFFCSINSFHLENYNREDLIQWMETESIFCLMKIGHKQTWNWVKGFLEEIIVMKNGRIKIFLWNSDVINLNKLVLFASIPFSIILLKSIMKTHPKTTHKT